MKRQKIIQITASFILIFAVFVFTEIKAESKDRIIEICSEGTVYVPPGTKIVKCNGKVKKVNRVSPYSLIMREGDSCLCWNCCSCECGVIISCDGEPVEYSESDSIAQGSLCILWMDCD